MAMQSLTLSQNSVSTQKPMTSVGVRRQDAVSVTEATDYAGMLMGFFAQKDVGNPKIFAAGLVQVMSLYPRYVLDDVVSAEVGLPAKKSFMPSIAEVKQACEDAAVSHAMHARAAHPAKPDRATENTPEQCAAMLKKMDGLRAELARNAASNNLGVMESPSP